MNGRCIFIGVDFGHREHTTLAILARAIATGALSVVSLHSVPVPPPFDFPKLDVKMFTQAKADFKKTRGKHRGRHSGAFGGRSDYQTSVIVRERR